MAGRLIGWTWLLGAAAWLSAGADLPAQAKKSDSVVKLTAAAGRPAADGSQLVTVALAIDKGWHIYANPVGLKDLEDAQTVVMVRSADARVEYPAGTLVQDKLVGDYRIYENTVEIRAIVRRQPGESGPLEVSVRFQACNDRTCLAPAQVTLKVP
jgi:DsbC/DsbD-like thiol-disulfide interchange protein